MNFAVRLIDVSVSMLARERPHMPSELRRIAVTNFGDLLMPTQTMNCARIRSTQAVLI